MLKNFHNKFGQSCLSLKMFSRMVPPRLYARVVGNYVKNALRLFYPSSAVLGLTYRCQCRCVHCSAGNYKIEKNKELSTREWFSVLDAINALGVPRINLSGGEALLRDDIFEIVAYAAKRFVVVLESNGQLLTKENVLRLKKSRISCVAVSIDSYLAGEHDRLRNLEGCYNAAVEGISNLVRNKLPCLISTYLTAQRADRKNIDNLMCLARKLKVMAVRVMPPRPTGSFSCHEDSLLSAEEEKYILKSIDPSLAYFKGMPAPKFCGIFSKSTFYISPYGQVQPCPYLPFSFGSLREFPLAKLLQKMWGHDVFLKNPYRDCLVLNKDFRDKYLSIDANNPDHSGLPIEIGS